MKRTHVAIVRRAVADELLSGRKTVETRFYRSRRPPLGSISPGDRVHFKLSGGGWLGTSQVSQVKELNNLSPAAITRLQRRYARAVRAPRAYWEARRDARCGVLIWLGPLAAPHRPIAIPRQYGSAWIVMSHA